MRHLLTSLKSIFWKYVFLTLSLCFSSNSLFGQTITSNLIDSDGDGVSNYFDLDDDNDGIRDINEGCTDLRIFETIGEGDYIQTNDNFQLNGTEVTYTTNDNTSFYAYLAGNNGESIRMKNISSNEYLQFEFSNAVDELSFKITDFDEEEELSIEVYAEGSNTPLNLNQAAYLYYGSQINRNGNTFSNPPSNNVNGNDSSTDHLGSIKLYFTQKIKRVKVITNYNNGGTLRLITPSFCVSDIDNDLTLDYLDLDTDNDGCPDALEGGQTISFTDLENSTESIYSGTETRFLGNTVATTGGNIGLPTMSNNGQSIGQSQNANLQDSDCDLPIDTDEDGIVDHIDLDDDNDGILDSLEQALGKPLSCNDIDNYSFNNSNLISGADLNTGAVYRFPNVKSGVDGLVTILNQDANDPSNSQFGLENLDDNANHQNYWKPIIYRNTKFIEFKVDFVYSGTSTPVNIDEMIVNLVDIDGSSSYVEYYEFTNYSNYSTEVNTNLTVQENNGALKILGHNQSYSGVSLTATDVLASVNFENKNSFTFKIGVQYANESPSNLSGYRLFALSFEPCDFLNFQNPSQNLYVSIDSDNDGIPNHLDLDSDNDGCSDANEAYNSDSADGNDGGEYGNGSPLTFANNEVDNLGKVVAANYTTTSLNSVVDSLNNATCAIDPCLDPAGIDTDNDGLNNLCDEDSDNDGILDEIEGYCSMPSVANSNTGSGVHQEEIYFFNWTSSDFADGLHSGDQQIFNLSDGLTITATFSNVVNGGSYVPTDMLTWPGAYLQQLYNTPGANEAFYGQNGQNLSLTVTFTGVKNGQAFPLDLLALDAESTNAANEMYRITTNGSDWKLVEEINSGGVWIGEGTSTIEAQDTEGSGGNSIYYSKNASVFDIELHAGGRQAFAFGIWLLCDADNDGIPNREDLDSDNDGIYDVTENQGTDSDNDGMADDTDGNSSNDNGIPSSAGNGLTLTNTIQNTPHNYINTDSDNDGCSDANEAYGNTNADGGDGEQYGSGDPLLISENEINSNGTVVSASYEIENYSPVEDTLALSICVDPIVALNDSVFGINGENQILNLINVLSNDTLNGGLVQISEITLTEISSNPNLVLNTDGSININANTPAGNHEMTYSICENANPNNCEEAVVVVQVIEAIDVCTDEGVDTDNDGINDVCDDDSDNDGILNSVETSICDNPNFSLGSFFDDFGTGVGRTQTQYIGSAYTFASSGNTVDGKYSIVSIPSAAADYSPWQQFEDHTSGDVNGKMLVVNASLTQGEFYRRSLTGLLKNVDVELSFWVRDVCPSCNIRPDITYAIEEMDGNVLTSSTTNPISNSIWNKFTLITNAGQNEELQLVLTNNGPGGGGNDLAIDDISLDQKVCDNDSDGIPNHLDLDSDNDGISDVIENNGTDINNDGLADDADGNSSNNNGIPSSAGSGLAIVNSIETTSPNYINLDSDNDGCSDANEAYNAINADGNDGGQYGNGDPLTLAESEVLNNGLVSGLTYVSTLLPSVTDSTNSSSCTLELIALNDTINGINGKDGATGILTVFDNDSLNGVSVIPSEVMLTETVSNPNLVLNADGSVDVNPNTPAGTYELTYSICENLNPTNCETAVVTVEVEAAPIVANDDSATRINGKDGAAGVLTIFDNDSLNGVAVIPSEVTLTETIGNPNLVLNADGSVDVNPNTPAGTYELTYSICENLNPANCETAVVTVEVEAAPIVANDDSATGINGKDGAAGVLTIFDNDSLNGVSVIPSEVTLTETVSNPNLVLNTDGSVDVNPNTPAGTYELTYSICENLNPINCETAVVTVEVETAPIVANDDSATGINGKDGATGILTVFDNDSLNGVSVIPSEVTLTETIGNPNLVLNADGSVDVNPNTPAGTYELTYSICENLNPTNCETAVVTVEVEAAPIVANDDSATGINGKDGAAGVLTVFDNDSLNGESVIPSEVTLTETIGNPNLVLNANGSVDVNPNTPAGTYELTYSICENLNPTNCETAVVTVEVEAAPMVATDDSATGINGKDGATGVLTVFDNDSLNGVSVIPSEVTLTETIGNPNLVLNADGSVDVNPNTPAGTYELTYSICEILNPTNCETAVVTVEVEAAPIVANDDSTTGINGKDGATGILTVFDNDSLNGVSVIPSEVTLTETIGNPNLVLNADGSVDVNPNTPAGTYELTYSICENLNPTNCETAVVTVEVEAAPIVATNDSASGINGKDGATGVLTVFDNDSLNGVAVIPSEVTLTETIGNPNLVLNADGSVDVNPNTPAGTYELTYSICENLNPTNCETAVVTVEVEAAPIVATNDSATGINGKDGATGVLTVFDNDSLNGVSVIPSEVTLTETIGNPNLVLNTDGRVDVNPNTPAGTYELTYSICENLNPTNCETAVVTVEVEAAPIVATDDSATGINGKDGATGILTVFDNDSLNGVSVIPSEVTLTETVSNPNLVLNADGSVDVNPNIPAGTYELTYSICENLNPTNCETAVVTVEVEAAPIVATDDSATGINGKDGATGVLTVFENDSLNGVSVIPSEVTLIETIGNPNLVLNADGSVDVNPNTPAGTYELTYSICEKLNPTNCETGIVTVEVEAAPIVATDDSATGINGKDGATGVLTVFDNDSLNGVSVIPSEVTLTETVSNPNLVLNADGSVDVNPNTPAGTYELTYSICENLNPTNCETAVVTVEVEAAPIVATDDSATGINGKDGATGILTVFDNDSLNGVSVIPSEVTLTETIGNPNLVLNTDGSVDVNPNTPAGTYELTYSICENLNPTNCETGIVTVEVEAAPIVATNDSASGINGKDGATGVLTVFDNDSLNGVAVIPSEVTLTESISNPNLVLNADGSVDVNPNTPAGTYELTYSICENLNPTNCETGIVTVEVEAAPIVATNDSATGINGKDGATGVLTVFDNDSLNGVSVIPSEVTLTETIGNPNLVLNANGSVDVNPNTPAGTYELTYSICENLNPTNCETAVVTVEVEAAPIVATNDSATGINGKDGATGILTVFDNDSLNGVSVIPSEVTLTETIGNPNLVLNADGSVDVNPNTPAGTYELTYSICENLNPTNCETAVVTVEVEAAPIVATDDSATGINGKDGATGVLTVFENDSLNGVSVIPSEVTLTETIG
ncbi:MAG: beta strand repeat-containing protein, partial [Flavobacteriales bacterium]